MSDSAESSSPSRFGQFLPASDRVPTRVREFVPGLRARLRLLRRKWKGVDLMGVGDKLERLDETFVEDGARRITDEDVETVVERADAIEERFQGNGPLRRLLEDGRLLLELVEDIHRGRYQQVPIWTLSAAAFALLYVLNPLDVIPEALPVLGLIDDAAVVSACVALLEQDLYDYRNWRQSNIDRSSPSEQPSGQEGTETDRLG